MRESISIIVPVYNSAKTIQKCIDSLLNQTYPCFKLIIINDGSTDDTLKILKRFKDSRIEIISQNNKGVSVARNVGLDHANSKYVTFVDSDDYVGKNYLNNLIKGYENGGELSISGINYVINNKFIQKKFEPRKYDSSQLLIEILKDDGIMGYLWNKLWRLDIIKKNNLRFDPQVMMAEDLLFSVQYIKWLTSAHVLPFSDYYHCDTNTSLSKSTSLVHKNENYKKGFIDFINVEKKIINLIPEENVIARLNAKAKLGITYANFLRRIQIDNSISQDKKLKMKIHKYSFKYTFDVLNFKTNFSLKERIVFLLAVYNTPIIKMVDKYRLKVKSSSNYLKRKR